MLRFLAILLPLLLALAACDRAGPAAPATPDATFRAVVTVPALAGLVKPMLPKDAELRILMQPGRSEHGYEFTPTDIAALGRADLVVYVGLGLEPQVHTFIQKRPSDTRRVVRSNSRAPTSSSSLAIPTESVGCVTLTRCAAFENEPSSATARK